MGIAKNTGHSRGRMRVSWRAALVVAVGAACAVAVAAVEANHAVSIQVVGAVAGAVLTTAGVALAAFSWRRQSASELRSVLFAFGFVLTCIGGFAILAGAGLYH